MRGKTPTFLAHIVSNARTWVPLRRAKDHQIQVLGDVGEQIVLDRAVRTLDPSRVNGGTVSSQVSEKKNDTKEEYLPSPKLDQPQERQPRQPEFGSHRHAVMTVDRGPLTRTMVTT